MSIYASVGQNGSNLNQYGETQPQETNSSEKDKIPTEELKTFQIKLNL